jgi:hypothetical protein
MPAYRVYFLDLADHVKGPPVIVRCADDHEAMQQARRYLDGKPVEVWLDGTLVGRLEPDDGGVAPDR